MISDRKVVDIITRFVKGHGHLKVNYSIKKVVFQLRNDFGYETGELVNECWIMYEKKWKNRYNTNKGNFKTFLATCVKNFLIDFIEREQIRKSIKTYTEEDLETFDEKNSEEASLNTAEVREILVELEKIFGKDVGNMIVDGVSLKKICKKYNLSYSILTKKLATFKKKFG